MKNLSEVSIQAFFRAIKIMSCFKCRVQTYMQCVLQNNFDFAFNSSQVPMCIFIFLFSTHSTGLLYVGRKRFRHRGWSARTNQPIRVPNAISLKVKQTRTKALVHYVLIFEVEP